jgi:GntR family transcriptional regulator, transcriptional repressor for pyruvate dehydrogenase complex
MQVNGARSDASSSTVRFKKASQIVADALRSEIGSGLIGDGDLLPSEPDLIARFGVSRPTLREAIRILETEGLLTTNRGGSKGHKIHHPTALQAARQASLVLQLRGATITDIFVLASILVPPAARMVAESRPQVNLEPLFELHRQMCEHEDDPRELARLVRKFDIVLCELSGNEAIKLVSQMMAEIIELQIDEIPATVAGLPPENAAQIRPSQQRFERVLQSIADGDGERAEALMQLRLRDMVGYHRKVEAQERPLRMIG